MSVVHGPPLGVGGLLRPTTMVLAIAVVAASVGYAVHHVPPAGTHQPFGVFVAVLGAAVLAAMPALLAVARRHPTPPMILVPGGDEIMLRPYGSPEDAEFGAALHAAELDHGFFVELGPSFLRAYQRTFADSPHAVAFIATLGGQPVGMLVAVLRPAAHVRWVLRRRGLRLAAVGAAALLVRPRLAWRFARTRAVRYVRSWRRRRGPSQPATEEAPYAVLSHVAVIPGARGSGAGAALVKAFEQAAGAAGIDEMRLVTRPGADGAGPFYERLGWHAAERRTTADATAMQSFRRRVGR